MSSFRDAAATSPDEQTPVRTERCVVASVCIEGRTRTLYDLPWRTARCDENEWLPPVPRLHVRMREGDEEEEDKENEA